jgi:HEAT repeat protein
VKALEAEADADVQLSLVAALGRVATADAVQRLIALAEPGGRLFNKKSTALRVAAVLALGEAKSPAANATLAALADDREKEVREAVARALNKRE